MEPLTKERQWKTEYKASMEQLEGKYNYTLSKPKFYPDLQNYLQNFQNLTSSAKCEGDPDIYYQEGKATNHILCSIKDIHYIPKYNNVRLEDKSTLLNYASFYLRKCADYREQMNDDGKLFRDIINYNIKIRDGVLAYNIHDLPTNYTEGHKYNLCFLIYKPKTYEILIAALVNLQNLITNKLIFTYCIDLIKPEPKPIIYAYMDLKEIFEDEILEFRKTYIKGLQSAPFAKFDTRVFVLERNEITIIRTMIRNNNKKNKYLKYKNKYLKLKNILLKNE